MDIHRFTVIMYNLDDCKNNMCFELFENLLDELLSQVRENYKFNIPTQTSYLQFVDHALRGVFANPYTSFKNIAPAILPLVIIEGDEFFGEINGRICQSFPTKEQYQLQ